MRKLSFSVRVLKSHLYGEIKGSNNIIRGNPVLAGNIIFDIKGSNNTIDILNQSPSLLDTISIEIHGDNNKILIDDCVDIRRSGFLLHGIGHNIHLKKGCRFKDTHFYLHDGYGNLDIGSGSTVESGEFWVVESHTKISLGKDCMLAHHVELRTGDSHSIIDLGSGERINPSDNVILGNHVWLGAHARVLKGVTIGDNTIIGMSSVVNRSVGSNCIGAGIPTKVIKENVSWSREKLPLPTPSPCVLAK